KYLDVPRLESPMGSFYLLAPQKVLTEVAEASAATACFSGQGGDQIFFQNHARLAFKDYLRCQGLRPHVLRFAIDAAGMDRTTLWRVLFETPTRGPVADELAMLEADAFMTQDAKVVVANERLFLHPWFECSADVPPGKLWHVMAISAGMCQDLYDPTQPTCDLQHVAPLLSQPLVELCLQIPTYILM